MSQLQFLYLATTGWKTGRQHRIEIWFVEYSGRYYIVSEHPGRTGSKISPITRRSRSV